MTVFDPDWPELQGVRHLRYYKPSVLEQPSESEADDDEDDTGEPTDEDNYTVIGSLCTDGRHRLILDIDVPCHVVPSSTPGHCHLYFPTVALDDEQHAHVLQTLCDAGVIGRGWTRRAIARGFALLRPPHIRKPGT